MLRTTYTEPVDIIGNRNQVQVQLDSPFGLVNHGYAKNIFSHLEGEVNESIYTDKGFYAPAKLRYFHARWLDTVDNVFLSVDPAINEQGSGYLTNNGFNANPYLFVYNNPLNVDWTGENAFFQ